MALMRRPLILLCSLLAAPSLMAEAGADFFEKKVRPLLIEHCQECHGPEKHKGGLRLDHREGWMKGGDSGPALTPGKPDLSRIIKAISYTDRDLKMPPKRKLSAGDVAILTEWIAQGAYDPRTLADNAIAKATPAAAATTHWAFQPVQKPAVPTVKDAQWPRNDIDRFVLAKLESQGLKPAPDAAPSVLERRLAYDLTGLPPGTSGAGSGEVAELLDSPAFAERWAQHWLDAARFSESSGGGRTLPFKDAWRYRDYVIESIRDDVPLDRFITEQIAGDLMPYESAAQRRRQITATGFLVLGPNNYEEQDKAALRMDIVDEQLDVIGKSLLGMSISCARCHDHKFDPIPTRDYYALAGILRSTKVIRDPKENVAHWIDTPLPLEGEAELKAQQEEANLVALKKQAEEARKQLKKLTPKREPKDGNARPLAIDEVPGIVVDDSQARRVGEWAQSIKYPTYIGKGYLHDDDMGKGTMTLTFMPKIERGGRYEVRFAFTSIATRATNVPVHILHADGEEDLTVDQSTLPPIGGRYVSLGQFRFEANGQAYVMISNEGTKGHVTADAVVFVPVEELPKLAAEEEKDDRKSPELLAAERHAKKLDVEVKKLEKAGSTRPVAMSVIEHEDLGDCQVHIRGNLRNLGDKVPRGYLQAAYHGDAPKIPAEQSGRLQMAQWMTSPQNTLTARVLANRVWMHLFGEGLVRSVENFGVTGDKPSHPELLDHLALRLIQDGWSLKKLVNYIADSRAYRMSSEAPADSTAADPANHLLSHQNRKRMDANALRDAMLVMAGTLDRRFMGPTIGGESAAVDPNDTKALNQEYNYVFSDSRRSVYTPAFRNKRLELFEAFDFGNNNMAIAKRNTSTVSLQALYMLNHEFVIQQSRAAAKLMLADPALKDSNTRLERTFQSALGRAPNARERQLAADFVRSSPSDETLESQEERWALLVQSLFACVDFRYIE